MKKNSFFAKNINTMKHIKLFLLTLAISSMCLSGVNAQNIFGNYTGTVNVNAPLFGIDNEEFDGVTVELATDGSDHYFLVFEEIDLGGYVVPGYELDNVIITPNGSGYTITRPGEVSITIPEITIPGYGTLTNLVVKIKMGNGSLINNVMKLPLNLVAMLYDIIPIPVGDVTFEGSMDIQEFEYDPVAVACINAMIDNNGLDAEKNKPETWEFADWSDEENPIQLIALDLDDEELFGTLSLVGLSQLTSLECRMNNLTEIILTGCTLLEEIYCWGNHLSAIDLTGLDALTEFVGEGQSIQLTLVNDGSGNYICSIPLNSPTFSETAISYEAGILKSTDPAITLTFFTVETGNSQFQLSGGLFFTYTGVGIAEKQPIELLKVYPNPTHGELTIDNGELTINNVEIFDIYGRKYEIPRFARNDGENSPPCMEGWQPKADGVVLNISHLPAGIYFLKIDTEKGSSMQKVIKQ
jgi:hypothetical protein